ncbi:MAG: GxxExxY protein [Bacteroidota bacterium]
MPNVLEDYETIKHLLTPTDRKELNDLRTVILEVIDLHGLGYGQETYQKLLLEALKQRNIKFSFPTVVPVKCNGRLVKYYKAKLPTIANNILCSISVLKKNPHNDMLKLKTYLRDLNLPFGIFVHFKKSDIIISGVTLRKS